MNRTLETFLPAVASALLAIALFAISIGGTYIYDDVGILQLDPRLRDPAQWVKYWTESYNQGVDNLYRPLVSMSYAIQWWLHGDRPWAFHLINVLLHAGVTACLAEFARRTMGTSASLIVGLLFAAHPVHVEAVANIVGRAELMCSLGIFGALVLFTVKPLTRTRAIAITACFLLALLSKEQGMLLPLLLLVYWAARRMQRADAPSPADRNGLLLLMLFLCWLLAGYLLWRERILKFWWDRRFIDWTINPMIPSEWHPHGGSVGLDRWLMPLALLGRYVWLLIAPIRLSPDYGAKVIGWTVAPSDPYLWLGAAAIATWFAVLILCLRRRNPVCVFAAISLALTYGVIGNIVTLIGTNFAERLIYLPSAFFLILLAAAISPLPRKPLVALLAIALALASIRTFTYTARWNDRLNFYEKCLAEQPNSIRLYMLLAAEYMDRGRFADAERVLAAGRQMLGEYWEIWVHSGVAAMRQNKFDLAQQYFDHAMSIRPSVRIEKWMLELEKRRAATQISQ